MAIYDRWWRDERVDDGTGRLVRTGKNIPSADYGCPKRWQVRWRDEQGRQRKQAFAKKTDAEKTDTTIQAQLLAGTYVDPAAGDVRFQAFAEEWRKGRMHDTVTADRIERSLRNHAYSHPGTPSRTKGGGLSIGDYPMRVLAKRVTLLQGWIKGLALGPNTALLTINDVSQVFTAAVDDGIITRNPPSARSVQRPDPVKTEAVPWTVAEIDAVATKLPARYAAIPHLAAATGARQGELFAVALEHLDFLSKTLHVGVQVKLSRGRLHFAPVKNKKPRDIPVADRVVKITAEHVQLHPPVPVTLPWHEPANKKKHGKPVTLNLLFTRPEGGPLRAANFNYYWRRAWKAAGVPDRGRKNGCHVLRHTAASAWLSAGLNPAKVAACLGDTAEVMLRTYAHFMPDDDSRARQAMNVFFSPAPGPSGAARFSARCRNRYSSRGPVTSSHSRWPPRSDS